MKTDSTLSRRRLLAAVPAVAAAGVPSVAIALGGLAAGDDPIFAAIKKHKLLFDHATKIGMALSEAEDNASETHGHRPIPLIVWRDYHIGGIEIDIRRETLMAQGEVDPAVIEEEYRAAKARCEAIKQAGRDWDERTGLASWRREVDQARQAKDASETALATTKPTTPAGAAALISYVLEDMEDYDCEWHQVALATAADALRDMSTT
jgi:hypothetical protein